jgi:hypothetical protein
VSVPAPFFGFLKLCPRTRSSEVSLLGVKDKTVALFFPLPWRKVLLAGAVAVLEVGDYTTTKRAC